MISCPECDAVLEIEENGLEEGDTVSCEECGANLVVVATDPVLELEVESEGDLDDDEEFDDELDDEEDDDEEDDEEEEDEEEDWH
jgi:alpha-aminoadipate/glutamate carrier protein LysW